MKEPIGYAYKCAVVVTFSWDPQVSVMVFEHRDEAWKFIIEDVMREHMIDVQENGFDSEYMMFEDEERATLTTRGTETYITEWRIGDVFERG